MEGNAGRLGRYGGYDAAAERRPDYVELRLQGLWVSGRDRVMLWVLLELDRSRDASRLRRKDHISRRANDEEWLQLVARLRVVGADEGAIGGDRDVLPITDADRARRISADANHTIGSSGGRTCRDRERRHQSRRANQTGLPMIVTSPGSASSGL